MFYVIDRCSWDAFGYALNKSTLTDDQQQRKELIERLARELFDEELIFGTYTSYSEAYNRRLRDFTPVSREQWERELEDLWVEPEVPAGDIDKVESLWIFPTLLGQFAFLS